MGSTQILTCPTIKSDLIKILLSSLTKTLFMTKLTSFMQLQTTFSSEEKMSHRELVVGIIEDQINLAEMIKLILRN